MQIDFWFDFASTYSYLSAMRIQGKAASSDVSVRWRPFLLGPIFTAQGWDTSPFNIYAAKGNYMWRDMERRTGKLGLNFRRPDQFPQNSLLAARVAQIAAEGTQRATFCHNVFLAQFAENLEISDPDVVAACASVAGLPSDILEQAQSNESKLALRNATDEAIRRGIFGAPSFTVKDELFWGDDQLENALDWAVTHG